MGYCHKNKMQDMNDEAAIPVFKISVVKKNGSFGNKVLSKSYSSDST